MSSSAPAKESKLEFAGYLLVGACKLLIEAVEASRTPPARFWRRG